jgi:hypothetical protein
VYNILFFLYCVNEVVLYLFIFFFGGGEVGCRSIEAPAVTEWQILGSLTYAFSKHRCYIASNRGIIDCVNDAFERPGKSMVSVFWRYTNIALNDCTKVRRVSSVTTVNKIVYLYHDGMSRVKIFQWLATIHGTARWQIQARMQIVGNQKQDWYTQHDLFSWNSRQNWMFLILTVDHWYLYLELKLRSWSVIKMCRACTEQQQQPNA